MTPTATHPERVDGWNRPPVVEPDGEGELLEVAMGPHHPSTHGVFRMDVALDGERVVRLKPVFGYLHRNHEKIAEKASYLAFSAIFSWLRCRYPKTGFSLITRRL